MSVTRRILGFLPESTRVSLVGWKQDEIIFDRLTPQPPVGKPHDYAGQFPHLAEFSEKILPYKLDGKPSQLGLWIKPPADDSKPVYVVFHGLGGHWGKAKTDGEEGLFRLAWLNALADTGAGIIAVHARGQGLSRTDRDMRVGEEWMQQDVGRLAGWLERMHLNPRRMIVAGESMGGAEAAMLAQELTRRHKPPAVLGIINSFACMADPSAYKMREEGVLRPSSQELENHPRGERIRQRHIARMQGCLKHKFDTAARLKTLDPVTRLYIANAPADDIIPFDTHGKLVRAGEERGLQVTAVRLGGDRLVAQAENCHTNWDPAKVTADLQACYESSHRRSAARRPATARAGQGR